MKTSSTLVTGLATVCLAFFAGVSAAPVENAAAAAEKSGPKDVSHPHWKKPIPIWSHHTTPTLEARTPQVASATSSAGPTPTAGLTPTAGTTPTVGTTHTASPTHTAGAPVPGIPTDGQFSWGQGYTLSILTNSQAWLDRNRPPATTTAYPTILACDGQKHPESYSWDKCISGISKYYKDERQKHWEDEIKIDAKQAAIADEKAAKSEADRKAKQEKAEKKKADAEQKAWEHERKKGIAAEEKEAKKKSKHGGGH